MSPRPDDPCGPELGPKARAATALDAAKAGDQVVVTIPLKAIAAVPVEPLAGKIFIDTPHETVTSESSTKRGRLPPNCSRRICQSRKS
jgi:predicted dinucleotide-binding enzyme